MSSLKKSYLNYGNYRRRYVPFESPIDSNWRSRSLDKVAGEVLTMTVEDNEP